MTATSRGCADAVLLADLEQPPRLDDRIGIAAPLGPAQEQPGPFELVARLDDAALVARHRRPVVIEEFAQRAGFAIDEMTACRARDLIGKIGPGDSVETFHLFARQARLEQMHMRVGAERQARRIVFLEAGGTDACNGLRAAAASVLLRSIISGFRSRKDLSQIGKGQKCEGLVVEIEGGIDQMCRPRPPRHRKSRSAADRRDRNRRARLQRRFASLPASPVGRLQRSNRPDAAGRATGGSPASALPSCRSSRRSRRSTSRSPCSRQIGSAALASQSFNFAEKPAISMRHCPSVPMRQVSTHR